MHNEWKKRRYVCCVSMLLIVIFYRFQVEANQQQKKRFINLSFTPKNQQIIMQTFISTLRKNATFFSVQYIITLSIIWFFFLSPSLPLHCLVRFAGFLFRWLGFWCSQRLALNSSTSRLQTVQFCVCVWLRWFRCFFFPVICVFFVRLYSVI